MKLIGLSKEESLTVVFQYKGKASEDVEVKKEVKNIDISGNKIIIYY